MTTPLQWLVTEAQALGGAHPCVSLGHLWESEGGRVCPLRNDEIGCDEASQTVYRCARCGDYDYGEPGGPGYADCMKFCDRRPADETDMRAALGNKTRRNDQKRPARSGPVTGAGGGVPARCVTAPLSRSPLAAWTDRRP
jgi:hypothetical protein